MLFIKSCSKIAPAKDYDILIVGDFNRFIKNVRRHGFIYGKIRKKNDVVLKKN